MEKWAHKNFEGKHIDERILHFTQPSKIQLGYELFLLITPVIILEIIFMILWMNDLISLIIFIIIALTMIIGISLTISYKIYRTNRHYLYITNKRIIFHGINGLFNDYIKRIHYENIINVNFFTESLIGRIFGYGTVEIQTAHSGLGDIRFYNINNGKMLTLYIDKIISLDLEGRSKFSEFDITYFKNWKNK